MACQEYLTLDRTARIDCRLQTTFSHQRLAKIAVSRRVELFKLDDFTSVPNGHFVFSAGKIEGA